MLFLEENSKTCFAFHFPALETLFLEHSISQNNPAIANSEFENHGSLKSHVFLPFKQAGKNIY